MSEKLTIAHILEIWNAAPTTRDKDVVCAAAAFRMMKEEGGSDG